MLNQVIIIKGAEMRSILKQAVREQEANKAGFDSHDEMVTAHRVARQVKLLAFKHSRSMPNRGFT